jgi:hypothetical protein
MTAPESQLEEALAAWSFEPGHGDWDEVVRRSAEPSWNDVLRRARERRRFGGHVSRRAVVAAAGLLLVAAPALGLVVATQTLGRESAAGGLQLTAQLRGEGASGSLVISLPGVGLGPGDRRVPFIVMRANRSDHRLRLTLVWELRLRGPRNAVESVSLHRRGGTRIATLCSPCPRDESGRTTIQSRRSIALFNDGAYVDVTVGGRTLRGPIRIRGERR